MGTEKIAILSDIHGNSPALQAVLDDIQRADCTQMWVLGDIINGLDPAGCITLLWQYPKMTVVKGNAEYAVLTPHLEMFPHREDPLYRAVIALAHWWKARLSASALEWLHDLPDIVQHNGTCLVHDSPHARMFPCSHALAGIDKHYWEFCFHGQGISHAMSPESFESLLNFMDTHHIMRVFCGHTHTPFCRQVGQRIICNVGSVGLPLDGDPRAGWVLARPMREGEWDLTIRRVSYAIDQIVRLIEASPDYPDFANPLRRRAYTEMVTSGIHWRLYWEAYQQQDMS